MRSTSRCIAIMRILSLKVAYVLGVICARFTCDKLIYQALKLHIRHRQFSSNECGVSMLRIETEMDGARIILRLIGRVRSDCIEELRQQVQSQVSLIVLDLAEVDIVELQSVRFLRDCQDRKIELRNCAPYILEWIRRERIEGLKR